MEHFSLEKYLANPSRKVVTRDSRRARIIYADRRNLSYPIIALIENKSGEGETTLYLTKDGKFYNNGSTDYDLFFAPEKHEGWVNVYRNSNSGRVYTGAAYDSKEDAEKHKIIDENYVTTIKIEWEE